MENSINPFEILCIPTSGNPLYHDAAAFLVACSACFESKALMTSYPPQASPRTNGLGIAGFVVSLVGLFFSCGLLCPIGLIMSFVALFRSPRGFAAAGFFIGLIGSIIPTFILLIFGVAIFSFVKMGVPGINTLVAMQNSRNQISAYASTHGGALPDDADGQAAIASDLDGWGHPLHYTRISPWEYEIRSAGPDGILGNSDNAVETFRLQSRSGPE
jgi:hypothetical protein